MGRLIYGHLLETMGRFAPKSKGSGQAHRMGLHSQAIDIHTNKACKKMASGSLPHGMHLAILLTIKFLLSGGALRITAIIALTAILALSFGTLIYQHGKACCGTEMPMDAGVHGLGPCLGLCTTAVSTASGATGLALLGWFFSAPLLRPLPILADPIEKPPA